MQVFLPYGSTTIPMDVPPERVIHSKIGEIKVKASGEDLVKRAMEQPIGSTALSELAKGKKNAVIIISDHTRPVPSRDIIPLMLTELRRNNPNIDITLLVATGCHRSTSYHELEKKLGKNIVSDEHIVIHDAFDAHRHVELGILPSGTCLMVDRIAAETELLVAEGFIEPHFFAGFSGGRKSVLPGICDKATIYGNHCGKFIDDPMARTGILEGNPIHRDMVAAALMCKLQYIVNVIIDDKKNTVAAFAGNFQQVHSAGVSFLRKYCQARPIPADIVVTTNGGAPLDQNLYQCVKGLTTAEATAKTGATIILCAEMADGIGGQQLYEDMRTCTTPAQLYMKFTNTEQNKTTADQWQAQILCRVLSKHRVIFVTRPEMRTVIHEMKMEYAPDLETALKMAGEGEITVVPNGISICIGEMND